MKNLLFFIRRLLLISGFALFSQSAAVGSAIDTLMVGRHQGQAPALVGQYLQMIGTNQRLDVTRVAYELPASAFVEIDPKKGFSEKIRVKRHYWLKLLLKNTAPVDTLVYFQFHSQVVDTGTCYVESGWGNFQMTGQTGEDLDFDRRIVPTYDMVFPIWLKTGETKFVLLKIDVDDGNEFHMFPELSSSKNFQLSEGKYYVVVIGFSAIMGVVFILNLLLGLALRKIIHFLYGIYTLVAWYEIFTMCGADIQFLYPHHPEISGIFQHIAPCVLGILMTLIMQEFLEHRTRPSVLKPYVNAGLYLIIFMTIVCVVATYAFTGALALQGCSEQVLAFLLLLQCLLFFLSAIERISQGFKPAWFYLAAIAVFDAGLIQFILMVLFNINQEGVLNSYPNLVELGIAWETVVVFIGIVYSYRQTAHELAAQKDKLLSSVVAAEEGVRARISRDLHDGIGAMLGNLSRQLSNTTPDTPLPQLESVINNSLELANSAYQDVRMLSHELAPVRFQNDWLIRSLEKTLQALNQLKKTEFQLYTEGDDRVLPKTVALMVYHILNEIISNIVKHALASKAYIQIFITENNMDIFAEDNGIGFDVGQVEGRGIGLMNIRSRVEFMKGELLYDSSPKGTHISIRVCNYKSGGYEN